MTRERRTTAAPSFWTWKERWLVQVACDARLPPTGWRIAVLIAKHLNHASREAYPSQTTMAKALDCHVDTVARAIESMAERGHLSTRREGHGMRHKVHYRALLKAEASPQRCGDRATNDPRSDAGIDEPPRSRSRRSNPRSDAPGIPAAAPPTIPAAVPSRTGKENLTIEPDRSTDRPANPVDDANVRQPGGGRTEPQASRPAGQSNDFAQAVALMSPLRRDGAG
jgi:hypothetical protein